MSASDIFHHAHIAKGELMLEDDSALATLPNAVQHKLEDWLALELTAERMAQDELLLVGNYIASDAHSFVDDIKNGLLAWELTAFDFLLQAADPSELEWRQNHWWDAQDSAFH